MSLPSVVIIPNQQSDIPINKLFENGYVRISNDLCDFIPIYPFRLRERRLFDVIYRQTIGYNKVWDDLSVTRLGRMSLMERSDVRRTLANMIAAGIVLQEKGRYGRRLKLNLNFKTWRKYHKVKKHWNEILEFRAPKHQKTRQEANRVGGVGRIAPNQGEKGGAIRPIQKTIPENINKQSQQTAPINPVVANTLHSTPEQTETGHCGDDVLLSLQKKKVSENIPAPQLILPTCLQSIHKAVMKLLKGVPYETAQELVDETAAQIERHKKRNNPIRNIGGYFARIVQRWRQGTYTSGFAVSVKKDRENKRILARQVQNKKEEERRQKEQDEQKQKEIGIILSNMGDKERQSALEHFIDFTHINNAFLFRRLAKNDFAGRMFDMMFGGFVHEHYRFLLDHD
ncbi:MAG: replication protein [Magnetococcales bacterium]|nr:replication protein [Magnetococcales bacterium]